MDSNPLKEQVTEEDVKRAFNEIHELAIEIKKKLIARTPSKSWKLTISKMSDYKVIDMYLRMKKKGQI